MLKVLLVDDEPYILEGLKVMADWESHGFTVCGEATNGADALEMVKMCNPDLIITDIRMPVMDGLELIKKCYEQLYTTAKFVILSGYDEFSYVTQAMKYNAKEYLLKPLDDEELNKLLSKLSVEIEMERLKTQSTNRQIAFVANQCIRRLITGERKESLFNRFCLLLGLGAEEEIGCLLIDITNNRDRAEFGYDKMAARKIIEQEIKEKYQFNIFEDDNGRLGIVTCGGIAVNNDLEELSMRLLLKLKDKLKCGITIAVSDKGVGPDTLCSIYKSAEYALGFKFFDGVGTILEYSKLKEQQLSQNAQNNKFKLLLQYIKDNRADLLELSVQELFVYYSEARVSPKVIISTIKSFILEVVKLLKDLSIDSTAFLESALQLDKKIEQLTVSELKDAFLKECLNTADLIEKSNCSFSQLTICEIKEYIQQNYSKDIKLKNVAKQFFMNPVYLGQVFKKATGVQFNDYLNSVRIEEAIKLLRRTDMKITDIAKAVGYNNPKYFLSKFKASTNLPPSSFKTE